MYRYGIAAVVIGVVVLLYAQVMGVLEESPVTYSPQAPFPTDVPANGFIRVGDTVHFTATRCTSGTAPVSWTATSQLVRLSDGKTISYSMTARTVDPGCVTTTGAVVIMAGTPDGFWQLRATLIVQGHYRQHIVEWRTEPFEIRA